MTQLKSTPKTKKKRAPRVLNPKATALFSALAADRPDPRTELDFVNPYTLVVAVALSAQATDVGVNKATAKLFALADTPEKMLALGRPASRSTSRRLACGAIRPRTSSR